MATVLYIEASPLKERSHTIEVARAFLGAYREARPQDTIETIDLWAQALPPFDGATIEAKFAVLRKKEFTPLQQEKWDAVRAVARRFNAADKYVLSVPMWNFSVPYPLKHYIDVVTLAGENWTWSTWGLMRPWVTVEPSSPEPKLLTPIARANPSSYARSSASHCTSAAAVGQ